MTCPCKDMKILQRQLFLHDFDGLLNGDWRAQSLHGLWIFQGIQVQGVWVHPRPFPALHLPHRLAGLLPWLHLWLRVGAVFPPPFHAEIPVSASEMNPAVPWCFVSLSKRRHLWCLFYTCAFIVTLREEELDRRNAMSRIPWKHSLFPLPCALSGFHHKSAILRLLVGLRGLICCLSFPLQCTPRAA